MHSEVRDAALCYTEMGMSVIPLKPRDKRPAISAWKPYTEKRADANLMNKWFQHDHNVAIVTGAISGLVVLDADAPDALDGLELPDSVEAITGSGGRHLYYKAPSGVTLGNRARLDGRKLDIRAENGYVVCPPSVHPNGTPYRWRQGHAPWEIELAELPATLVRLIQTHEVPERDRVKIPEPSGGTPAEPPADFIAKIDDPTWDDVASIWNGHRPPPDDDSRSGWDYWLAIALARHGVKAAEMARILRAFRRGRGTEATGRYLSLTITRALEHEKWRARSESRDARMEAYETRTRMSDIALEGFISGRAMSDTPTGEATSTSQVLNFDEDDEDDDEFRCTCGRWILLRHKFTEGRKKRVWGRGSRCDGCKRLLRHQRTHRIIGALGRWGEAHHIIVEGQSVFEALVKRIRRQRLKTGLPLPYFYIQHKGGLKHLFTTAAVGGELVDCSDPKKLESLLIPLIDGIDPACRRGIDGSQGWQMEVKEEERPVEWERFAETTKSVEAQDRVLAEYRIHVNAHGEFNDAHLTDRERIDLIRKLVRVAKKRAKPRRRAA